MAGFEPASEERLVRRLRCIVNLFKSRPPSSRLTGPRADQWIKSRPRNLHSFRRPVCLKSTPASEPTDRFRADARRVNYAARRYSYESALTVRSLWGNAPNEQVRQRNRTTSSPRRNQSIPMFVLLRDLCFTCVCADSVR